ncbi:hypothetical protein NUW54_g11360 [Trametes sanguinea]|uniref:Uncharacterized protein n=1 Tax=Trametes sanguinea TaxID=158606 RepID=A0ACC1NHA9_9APHY|nr:hypothetical protein NUW54_g11360 [Trametes sanguinea]
MGETVEQMRKRVAGVKRLDKVHMILHECRLDAILEHHDVGVVNGAMGMLLGDERCQRETRTLTCGLIVGREWGGRHQRDGEQGNVEKASHRRRRRRDEGEPRLCPA